MHVSSISVLRMGVFLTIFNKLYLEMAINVQVYSSTEEKQL